VPLDTYEKRSLETQRYSSYTKGYGNGGHVSRVQKTRYDSELDGEESDRDPPELTLTEISTYSNLLLAIEKEKIERRFYTTKD